MKNNLDVQRQKEYVHPKKSNTSILRIIFIFIVYSLNGWLFSTSSFADLIVEETTVNAASFGFNEQNATKALQAAIWSGAKKVIVSDTGKPWIVDPIFLESNQEILFEKGVVVLARKDGFRGKNDSLFEARNKENIILSGYGAEWIMRKSEYQSPFYDKSEWRHCLALRGCRNVIVSGLRIANSGGDGIYIGRGHGEQAPVSCEDIQIRDIQCEDHHRQGISIISARNLLIEKCSILRTKGTAPQYGIDFEPNRTDEYLENCVVRNCTIAQNAAGGILIWLKYLTKDSRPISITLENCRILGNGQSSIMLSAGKESFVSIVQGVITLSDNEMDRMITVTPIKGITIRNPL